MRNYSQSTAYRRHGVCNQLGVLYTQTGQGLQGKASDHRVRSATVPQQGIGGHEGMLSLQFGRTKNFLLDHLNQPSEQDDLGNFIEYVIPESRNQDG